MTAGSLTLSLRTAQSGLLTNQQVLDTVANNVANVNTPGYSRKIANTEQRVLSGVGSGVQLAQVTRSVDEGLIKSLRRQLSEVGTSSVQDDYYGRIQEMFGTPSDNTSLAHLINNFTNALETLSVSPDKVLEQSDVVNQASAVTDLLASMTEMVQDLRLQADREISTVIEQANSILSSIADLNDKIVRNKAISADVTDLQDQRDKALDDLSKLIDIRYFYNADGDAIVFSAEGKTLVSNVANQFFHAAAGQVASTTTHAEGDFGAIRVLTGVNDASSQTDVTNEISNGQLKGLIDLRDDVLANLQSQIDELAAGIRDTFNQVHNRGVSFPGSQTMVGSRAFVNPAAQSITYTDDSDTHITLFDSSGDQVATTTIRSLLGSQTGTINDIATVMEAWLQANGAAGADVGINNDRKFEINLNSDSVYLGFRDEVATAAGSTQQDAPIGFNSDADNTTGETYNTVDGIDELVNGFSYFFGLNDFFIDRQVGNIQESNVKTSFTATAATLSFTDANGTLGTVAIAAGDNLETIASKINSGAANIEATVIPDGSGFRLRVSHTQGIELVVTQATGNTLLGEMGLHKSDVRTAGALRVREDIAQTPSLMVRGSMQWNASLGAAGEYFVSEGDGSIMADISDTFSRTNAFAEAGGIPDKTLSFSDYAAAIIGKSASLAAANESQLDYNQKLGDALQFKSDSFRGVNLDEEMSNLILYEQAYSAAARVITVIQNMFDALDRAIA